MLVIVGILIIFGIVIRCKWMNGASRKEEILRLVAGTEADLAKAQSIEGYNSPAQLILQLESQYSCAVCYCPTTTRCSRCKAVRYCSGKCQIIHWRQGHKNDCQPAIPLHASKGSDGVAERTSKNQFVEDLNEEAKICFGRSGEFYDSASSNSSASCVVSSTQKSETSFDNPACSVVESGTPTRPEKKSSSALEDIRNGDSAAVFEEFHLGGIKSSSRSSRSIRRSSAEGEENLAETSTSKLPRSMYHKYTIVEQSSECSNFLKMLPSDESRKQDPHFSNESQSSGKGLKTSVRKLMHHFRAPKLLKSQSVDILKQAGGNYHHKAIFSVKLFMQLYLCEDLELHPFGLVNCGNSCYANAVLQCLIFTRPIASYLLTGLHSKTCWKRGWCFFCKFEHLVQKGHETNSPLPPVGLLSQIQPIGREEDAHEFLRNVVDKMQSVCLEKAGVSGSLAEDSTLMGLTFGGYLRSKIKCMKCLGRFEQCDRMMDLNVEIDGNICTLEEALAQFTASEALGGDDKYKCSRCKSYQKATKRLSVIEAPNILTIVLKRFQAGNMEKLNKFIQFPEVLNLSRYMSGICNNYPIYHLYAVVVHLGITNAADSGHYVSYVKDFRGNWFRVDDSRVSRVDAETVLSVEAYILFYSRHTPRVGSYIRNGGTDSDGKAKANMEAISSSKSDKKRHSKMKLNSSHWDTGLMMSHQSSDDHLDWLSANDFDPDGLGFHLKHRSPMFDTSSDSSSIFSVSDAGSYSTDSTKNSSAEDISGYIFGSNWLPP